MSNSRLAEGPPHRDLYKPPRALADPDHYVVFEDRHVCPVHVAKQNVPHIRGSMALITLLPAAQQDRSVRGTCPLRGVA